MFHQNQLVGRYRVKKTIGSGGFVDADRTFDGGAEPVAAIA